MASSRRSKTSRVAGLRADSPRITGFNVAGLYLKTMDVTGVSVSAYNRVRGTQVGPAIGVYNSARVLKGIQLGLLNRALNNKAPFKVLPLVNLHL